MDLTQKAKENTYKAFDKMLSKEVERKRFYSEAMAPEDDDTMAGGDAMVSDSEPVEPYETDDEGNDAIDNADDVLSKIDFSELDNNTKVELIETIIDSLQASTESDEEFSELMTRITEIIDGYQFEAEGEEGEIEDEDIGEEPIEDEGMGEKPAEDEEIV